MDLAVARRRIGDTLVESVYDNPIVVREFRTRMRGSKGFLVMGGYVLLLATVLFIAFWQIWEMYGQGPSFEMSLANRRVGQHLFTTLSFTQAILLTLVIPALTFGALTQEIEKKTIELLALTRLSAGKVVVGKHLSAFLYSMVLLVCSIPLAWMCLMFGGISPTEITITYLLLAAWAFLLASVGVFWSSLYNRTASAALFTYGMCGAYMLLTLPMGAALAMSVYGHSPDTFVFGALNPGWASMGALLTSKVCGITIPIALVPLVIHVAAGALLLMVASTHVRHHKVERALPIRLTLVGISVALTWLFFGNIGSFGPAIGPMASAQETVAWFAPFLLTWIGLAASVFATGPITKKPHESTGSYGFSPRMVFTSDLGGGMSFVVLWAGLTYAVFGATSVWAAQAYRVSIPPEFWTAYLPCGVAVLAMLVGVCAVGVLASSICTLRRNAAAFVILFIILVFAGYGIVLMYRVPGMPSQNGLVWQLAAFWPMTPILASTGQWNSMPTLWWPEEISWLVTSAAYLAIAAVALRVASAASKKCAGVRDV